MFMYNPAVTYASCNTSNWGLNPAPALAPLCFPICQIG